MKYAITGPYCDVNYGDYAMLVNNLAAFPDSPTTIFSFEDDFLRTVLKDYRLAEHAHVFHVDVAEGAVQLSADLPLTPLEMLRHVTNLAELRVAVAGVDAVIVNGGGYVNDLWARPHRLRRLLAIFAPAIVAAQLGKEIYFTANGFGPFSESCDMFASLLGRMHSASLTCRDALGSSGWLRRLGIAESRISLAPDDLMIIDDHLTKRAPRWEAPTSGSYIVLETYRPVEELERNLRPMLALQDELGAEVVVLPMNRAQGGEEQAEVLRGLFPRVHVHPLAEIGYLPVEDALSAIRGARLTVTDRYHGLVTALGVSAPVVSIIRPINGSLDYYYRKNAGVLEWRFSPGTYDESDFISLTWTELPATMKALEALAARQAQAYAASTRHFDETRAVRKHLIDRIFAT